MNKKKNKKKMNNNKKQHNPIYEIYKLTIHLNERRRKI